MDKGTIKVVYFEEPPTVPLTLTDVDSSFTTITDSSPQLSDVMSARLHPAMTLSMFLQDR